MTQDDPELGRMRWCNGCQEWWPDDEEFFIYRTLPAGTPERSNGRTYIRRVDTQAIMCRACHYERKRLWNERNDTDAERRERRLRTMREAARRYRQRRYDADRSATAG